MIKGFLFDYGGTLDTAGCHWGKMLWHAYEKEGVPVEEQDFRDAYVYAERRIDREESVTADFTFYRTLGVKLQFQLEYLQQSGKLQASDQQMKEWHKSLHESLYARVKEITAHSCEVLDELKKQQIPMVLVSNFYGNVETVLQEFGFAPYFKTVIESARVGIRKPDPRIYELGVEALGLAPEEVVVVGDSFPKDIVPAKTLGCKAYWFKGEGWKDEKYDESLADRIISDLSEISLPL